MRRNLLSVLGIVSATLALWQAATPDALQAQPGKTAAPGKVEYARDVLPILATHCFACHGPDLKGQKSGLRLDTAAGAAKMLRSGGQAIVPGDPKKSSLVARILAKDEAERMPPASTHKTLKDAEKSLLQRWIEEGAVYQQHWAFVAPQRPALPTVKNTSWARTPVDRFILAKLEAAGLQPSVEADRHTLARRVALDLTGLPPTLAMVDAFVNDNRADAYERYVDQVLQLPSYGERWAQMWLDLARYADSNGYATDNPRTIWKYRDWVIGALNRNQPFDQMTIEQLAGDLLPQATNDQILATAFHRNTLTNDEGGTNDEEFRVAAVVDRVNTTFQVWMGLTMACAQCHNHKYDAISQEEYFQVFAIFNQSADADRGDNSPLLSAATKEELEKKAALEQQVKAAESKLNGPRPDLDAALAKWEASAKADPKTPANIKALLALEAAKRQPPQKDQLSKYFATIAPELKAERDQIASLKKQLADIKPVTTPIMKDLPEKQRRVTKIHRRGNFLDQDKEVKPGTPAMLPPLPGDRPADRLALARWLVAPENPLTARVAVERYWGQLFGVGLVETPDDFGIRGKAPTHPELLDWLAVEFREQKWDAKQLLKLLVTSATYRQASKVTPALVERDPDNRLFARGPRYRAAAEMVRDQVLFVSGLLSPKMYGPPVRPPQPKIGLTAAFGPGTDWSDSTGDDKYRRALYTQWRRTTPYPSMITFDAPSRTVCSVQRARTNTPLQALTTLNDPVYVEAAQALARRAVKEGGSTVEQRVTYAFRLCLSRPPQPAELQKLVAGYQQALAHYSAAANAQDAQLIATQPLGPLPAGMAAPELAAWTVVSNVLLNLDEMFAKR